MRKWAINEINFRSLISFKNALFNSPELDLKNNIPIREYCRIRNSHDDFKIRNELCGTEDFMIQAVVSKDDPEKLCLNNFSDLIDCYVYFPVKESIKNQQVSPNMHLILSSNKKSIATAEAIGIPKGEE